MLKKTTLLFGLLAAGVPTTLPAWSAQPTQTTTSQKPATDANIIGHVLDKKTGEHLPGITIRIKGTGYGTHTDRSGHYFLKNLAPGTVEIIMQGVGYVTQSQIITLTNHKTIEVNFYAEEDDLNLDEVVVTANRQETLRRHAPTLVSVIDERLFKAANAVNLAQGLIFQPGLRVENNCQNCGFNQVRINGLDGRFSQILIDSRAVFSSLAGVYGLEQLPENMIDRVEIVRGGGSALYGSSAIAGVINIITKDPTQNSFSFSHNLTLTGGTSADNTLGFNASVIGPDSRVGAMVFGQSRERGAWDANGDGFSEIGKISGRSLGTRAYYRLTELDRLTAEVHAIQEYRRGGDRLELPDHAASVAERTDHNIYSGNVKYDHYSSDLKHHLQAYVSGQLVDRNSYYGGVGDANVGSLGNLPSEYGVNFGVTNGRTYLAGVQYDYSFDHLLFLPAKLLLGAEYSYDSLKDRMPLRQWEAAPSGGTLYPTIDQRIKVFSQMGQIEWTNEMWSILLGGRLDANSAIKSAKGGVKPIFSPRATLRYNPNSHINLRASYAKGFRAPQVFDEDLHVGVVQGEAQRITNAANLSPEYSHSFSLSADNYFTLGSVRGNLLIEGFYTQLVGAFTNNETGSHNGFKLYERVNGSNARVYGLNLETKFVWDALSLQAGLTFARSQWEKAQEWGNRSLLAGETKDNYAHIDTQANVGPATTAGFASQIEDGNEVYTEIALESTEMLRTPDLYGYFTLSYNPIKKLNLALTGNYTGRMYVPHAIEIGRGAAESDRTLMAQGKRPDLRAAENAPRWDELTHTPAFFELGAKLTYDFSLSSASALQVYMGANNLLNSFQKDFDVRGFRDSGYMYGPTMPRSYYVGLKLTL